MAPAGKCLAFQCRRHINVETVQTTETMRCVFTIKTVDLTWFNHDLSMMIGIWLDLAMKTGVYTIEKVDLFWEMRILHDFTKQKCDVILHFIDQKDHENIWILHIFTITSFFLTKNPWGFHPENAGNFTSVIPGIPGTSRTPGFAILVWLPSAIRASFPEDVEQLRGECGEGLGLGVRGFWWGEESSNIIKHGGLKQQMDRNDGKRSPGSAIFCWFNPAFCWFVTMKPYDLLIFNHETIWFNQQRLLFNDGKLRFKPFFRFDEVFMGISGWFG